MNPKFLIALLFMVAHLQQGKAQSQLSPVVPRNQAGKALATPPLSKVWVTGNGDGTYKNPVLHADYSDPDVIRVGDDFYMVSFSFEDLPGLSEWCKRLVAFALR